jgi:hypothetical protein
MQKANGIQFKHKWSRLLLVFWERNWRGLEIWVLILLTLFSLNVFIFWICFIWWPLGSLFSATFGFTCIAYYNYIISQKEQAKGSINHGSSGRVLYLEIHPMPNSISYKLPTVYFFKPSTLYLSVTNEVKISAWASKKLETWKSPWWL